MKLRIRKMHFLFLFFEHRYLAYYSRLTSEIFLDFFVGLSFYFIKSRKII